MPKTVEEQLQEKFDGIESEVQKLTDANVKKADTIQKLGDALKEQGKRMAEMLTQGITLGQKFDRDFDKFLDKNKDKLKNLYKEGGSVKFVNKAPETITTGSGTTPVHANINNDTILGKFNFESYDFIFSLVSRFSTDQASVPYTEMKPKEGDFAVVPEGDEKPQIDFTWETRYAEPQVSAAWEKLTNQSVRDFKRLKSMAKGYLKTRHDIHKSKQIIALAVSLGNARPFVAGAMADAIPLGDATFTDVVNAAATDIATAHNYEDEKSFTPNIVMVNPMDFTVNFIFAKDKDGRPLYPNASVLNRANVGGIVVIPSRLVATGKILVADFSNIHMSDYEGYSVRIGWVNDDFIKNQFVILGESTYHLYVKEQDKIAFIHDDYTTIKDAIEADS